MATKKTVKKPAGARAGKKPAATPEKKPAAESRREAAPRPAPKPAPAAPPTKGASGPTARTCPLVLDGESDAADVSSGDCLTCSEFDCRFCEAAEGSGPLRSRLFAGGEEGEEGDDGWGGDSDFAPEEAEAGDEAEGDEDEF